MENSDISKRQLGEAEKAILAGDAKMLEQFLIAYKDHSLIKEWIEASGSSADDDFYKSACSIIAYKHWFNNWSEFQKFREEVSDKTSAVAQFEKATEAVVSGDLEALKQLLGQHPDLIHARSIRNHHATLLHYVGANGVEDFRQKTPHNAVEVAEILQQGGAEIDAIADMYKGTTTLGLVATSVHPVKAGVQKELIDTLLNHGADLNRAVAPDYTEGNLVVACLHNGRGEAAAYLAGKGAPLDIEGAAGSGMLDQVKSYYNEDGSLKQGIAVVKRNKGFMWACEYGHKNVVEFMLKNGFDLSTIAEGMTALHWAVVGGRLDIIKMLLENGAPLEIENCYGGTILGQALWSAYNEAKPEYPLIIETLIYAGAKIQPGWNTYIDDIKGNAKKHHNHDL